jgi:ketosteroid isomerase-like protein
MSSESTDVDRAAEVERAFQLGLTGDIEGATRPFAEDAVWEAAGGTMRFEGLPAIRQFISEWLTSLDDYSVEFSEIHQAGDVLFAVATETGRPAHAAAGSLREANAYVITWEGAMVTRVAVFADVEEARVVARDLGVEA